MTNKLHLIYLPGIGDAPDNSAQTKAIRFGTWWGVESEIFNLWWADNVAWPTKFNRLLKRIDELHDSGKTVGLVGISAGASAAINAFAAREDIIHGVVCIAGKVNRPESIGQRYRQHNPSFVESVEATASSLRQLSPPDKSRILSRYAWLDGTVTRSDSRIPGAHNHSVPAIGHVFTIATQIMLGAPSFIRFLKRLPAKH